MPNSVDPDQTAPSVWSGSTLFAPAYMSKCLEVLWYVQFFSGTLTSWSSYKKQQPLIWGSKVFRFADDDEVQFHIFADLALAAAAAFTQTQVT